MFFQPTIPDIQDIMPFIIAALLIVGGIIIFKMSLVATKAESKTSLKWVAGSFLIQFGVTLFISAPMLLDMVLALMFGAPNNYRGPEPGTIAMVVIFSTFIVVNLINMMHKPGLIRSIIIALLILGPIIGSNYLIFSNLGNI
ncbi:MAG: hypothetical protein ACW98D_13370 [Promethearchaeota archaeon]|jgi:hypothetical protein